MPPEPHSAMSEPIITFDKVNKWYGNDFHVLRDIDLQVAKGERIVVCGPSGSGKSTLIRCINRLEEHQEGRLVVDGIELSDDIKAVDTVRKQVGMVFQQFNLFSNMTALNNCVAGQTKVLKRSRAESVEKAKFYLERVGMLPFRDARPAQLSGGQKQRAAIARALCMDPEVLLFDEPTSALDPEMVDEVLTVIRALKDGGLTMIIVTHEMAFARDAADRVVFMDAGKLVESGEPQQFFTNPQNPRTRAFLARTMRG